MHVHFDRPDIQGESSARSRLFHSHGDIPCNQNPQNLKGLSILNPLQKMFLSPPKSVLDSLWANKQSEDHLINWLQGPQPQDFQKINQNIYFDRDFIAKEQRPVGTVRNIELTEQQKQSRPLQYTKYTIYLPGKIFINYQTLNEFDFSRLTSSIEVTLHITIFCGGLQYLYQKLLEGSSLVFDDGTVVDLNKETCSKILQITNKEGVGAIKFVTKQTMNCSIEKHLFLSPFQKIQLFSSVQFRPIRFKIDKYKQYIIQLKVNFIPQFQLAPSSSARRLEFQKVQQNSDNQIKLVSGQRIDTDRPRRHSLIHDTLSMVEAQSFDKNFKFSSSFQLNFYYPTKGQCFMRYFHPHTDGQYNDTIEHKMFDRLKEKTKHGPGLNEVRIGLLVYKRPMVILLSIMLPMGLLSLINCAIFFQGNDIGSRNATLATLLVAYGTTVLQIRSSMIPGNKLSLMELVLYGQSACCILTLVQSYIIRDDEKYLQNFVWYKSVTFMAVVVIVSIQGLIIVILVIKYFTYDCYQYYNKKLSLPKWFKQRKIKKQNGDIVVEV